MEIKYNQGNIKLLYKGYKTLRTINITTGEGQYILSIQYINENGSEIFPTEVQTLDAGSEYDVSTRLETSIDGFQLKEVQGDVTGIITNNIEIVLIYEAIEEDIAMSVSYKIPYISYGYWNTKPYDTEEVVIPLYITDFYQKEYLQNDTSLRFKLRVELDGEITWIDDLPAGDYDLNLGVLEKGEHYFTVQVVDENDEESGRIANDIWVINADEYGIKDSEIYTVTDDDLTTYNITMNLDDTATAEQMQNNRVGLSQLFLDIKDQGYKKCILLNGIYRVNRTIRMGTIEEGTTPIDIPSNFTVDMNQSTFKLHPYSDSEYGTVAKVENLMVRFKGCIDSHLINGILEGDFAERTENGWISGGNGEHNNTVYIYGGRYNSLENIKIYQTTGYNVCTGQNGDLNGSVSLGALTDNIQLIGGEEVEGEGYCTSDYSDLTNVTTNYIVCSVWLGFGGIKTGHWDVDINFYDENKVFIEKIRVYQYRRCRVPQNAQYLRITFKGLSSEVSGISIHHMDVARYCEFKNCEWVDNRTCCAPFQFQHLYINQCNFTRSGQSITPCEIDLEDGWEQMQDFFLIDSHVLEHVGTASFIDNGGINHVIEECTGWNYMKIVYRVNGVTIRNNTDCGCAVATGWMTKNTVRICDNQFNSVTGGTVDSSHYLYEEMNYKYKNNIFNLTSFENFKPYWHTEDCELNITGYQNNVTIDNSIIRIKSGTAYLNKDLIYNNCTFELYEGDTQTKFSFNALDAYRLYNNCTFNNSVNFANHSYFNSGVFRDCVFNNDVIIANSTATKSIGELAFINCKFNGVVTADNKKDSYIEFINCEFVEPIVYNNTQAESLCVFSDEVNYDVNYISITGTKSYLSFNETDTCTSFVLPFYAINKDLTWNISNELADVQDGVVVAGDSVGEFNVICTATSGLSTELSYEIVDVDYITGSVYSTTGGYTTYLYSATDNRYKEVNAGSTISIASPNVNVSRTIIAEYDADKNFIQQQQVTTKPAVFTLTDTTSYIRLSFYTSSTEVKKTQLIYEYTITEN